MCLNDGKDQLTVVNIRVECVYVCTQGKAKK